MRIPCGMELTLPVPPSVNDTNQYHNNPFKRHRNKRAFQRSTWVAAVTQHKPHRDPPDKVRVAATLYHTGQPRDPDNANGSLKWTLDALRQHQQGDIRWRVGLYGDCGYFVDDDPDHLEVEPVRQIRVAKRTQRKLVLTLTEAL